MSRLLGAGQAGLGGADTPSRCTPPMMPGGLPPRRPKGDGCDADSDGGCWSRCWRPAAAPLTLTSPRAATTPTSGSPSTWFPTCSDQRHLGPGRRPAHRPQAGPAGRHDQPAKPGRPSAVAGLAGGPGAGRLRPPAGRQPPQGDRPVAAVRGAGGRVRPRLRQGDAGPGPDRPAPGRGRGP
jgi:hypothetical protein